MADYLAEYGRPDQVAAWRLHDVLARLLLQAADRGWRGSPLPPSRVLAADLGVDILADIIAGL